MKKLILLSACMIFGILLLVSFSSKKKATALIIPPASEIINCVPVTPMLITAADFKARYEPFQTGVRIRKNVDALTTPEINAIKVGIIKMKRLPYTDPTSWWYQAAIHGTAMTDNLPLWNSCHKVGETYFFLMWHRMYVYFLERILRAKSGRANLTIPYWNYQINPVMHPAFRDNRLGNPLYDGTRAAAINNGGSLPSSIMTAFVNSLAIINYTTFQNDLSSGPHGSVHSTIAGNMAVVPTAAQDPVFWLHHSNIDRLWEEWLSKCAGRTNPVDAVWLNKSYTFFDETGTAVSMTGSQVLKIAAQLNYKYDVLPADVSCAAASMMMASTETLMTEAVAVDLDGQTAKSDFVQDSPDSLEAYIKKYNRTDFNFDNATNPERLTMIFQGVKIDKMPEGVVEVYLNLPAGTTPVSTSKNFVGLMDLFSADHHSLHASQGMAAEDIKLDATKAAKDLGLKLRDLKKAAVTLIVRGNSLNGVEVKTVADITIRHIKFSVERFKK